MAIIQPSQLATGSYSLSGSFSGSFQGYLAGYVPDFRTLTINGTTQDLSANRTFTVSTGITIGTTAITSGVVGRVLFEGVGNVVQESANITWNNATNRLQIIGDAVINTLYIGLGNNAISTNTALGFQSLSNTNSVNFGFNTALGYQALNSLLGGGSNTAVGYQALKNSTGATNTAIGTQAGLNNSSNDNVFIGFQSGLNSINTSSTVAIGAYAALNNTLGTAITAIGRGALENTTGSSNVAIGFFAGRSHTSGTNNIFIGTSSAGVSNTDSNRTWIGNSSTTSTYLAGNVLINTTTDAGFKLDVNGTARVSGDSFLSNTYITAVGAQLGVGLSNPNSYYKSAINGNFGVSGLIVLSSDVSTNGTPIYLERTASLFNIFSVLPITFSVASERLRIAATGNVLINTTTDAGFKLDVNGTARVSGNVTANGYRVTANGEGLTAVGATTGIVSYGSNGASSAYTFTLNNQYGGGNINRNFFSVGDNFYSNSQFSGGINTVNWFGVYPVINNTNGTTTIRGIYYNPTLTAVVGTINYAFHSTSGRVRFEGLPTSPTGLSAGELWNNLGILTIV